MVKFFQICETTHPPQGFCEIWENERWNLGQKRRFSGWFGGGGLRGLTLVLESATPPTHIWEISPKKKFFYSFPKMISFRSYCVVFWPNHSFSCELSYQHCGGGICIWKPFSFSDSSHVPRNPSLRIYVAFCILLFREASPPLAQSSGMFSFISWLPRFSAQLALDRSYLSLFSK